MAVITNGWYETEEAQRRHAIRGGPTESQVSRLAALILDRFGRDDIREDLSGISTQEAERLSRWWLRQLL